jgi:hypothetical protein
MSTHDLPPPVAAQYAALHSGCGVVELSGWSSVTVSGADRQAFLNNFCTNDVKRLAPGTACEAFFTSVKGKIVAHALVTARHDEVVVVMVPEQAAALVAHLDHYLIREDVTLTDTSAERVYRLAAGDRAGEVVAQVKRAAPADLSLRAISWDVADGRSAVLVESRPAAADTLKQIFAEHGAMPCGPQAWEAARIEWGLPLFGRDFDGSDFPQEVGRNERAISFTKGCYLGQETVARIDALGHVNQQLVGVRFASADVPAAGTPLSHDGATVGHVRSAAFSPRLGTPLALAMVRHERTAPGSRLQSPADECEVVVLPV